MCPLSRYLRGLTLILIAPRPASRLRRGQSFYNAHQLVAGALLLSPLLFPQQSLHTAAMRHINLWLPTRTGLRTFATSVSGYAARFSSVLRRSAAVKSWDALTVHWQPDRTAKGLRHSAIQHELQPVKVPGA
eukprot:6185951-Pleurochrysis_carterae.AAC.1